MAAPDLVTLPAPEADDCATAVSMNPGRRAPYVDEAGIAGCRAQLVPPTMALELLQSEDMAAYWEERSMICHRGRTTDRSYCEYVSAQVRGENAELRRELQWQRVAAIAAGVTGFIVGSGLTVIIARIP